MEVFISILTCILMVLLLFIAGIIISFFFTVPSRLEEIGKAISEHNRIEKEKLKIMQNNIKKEKEHE